MNHGLVLNRVNWDPLETIHYSIDFIVLFELTHLEEMSEYRFKLWEYWVDISFKMRSFELLLANVRSFSMSLYN